MNRNREEGATEKRVLWLTLATCVALTLPSGCQHKSLLTDSNVLKKASSTSTDYETLVLQAGNWEKPEPPAPGTPQGDLQIAEALFRAEDYPKAAKAFEEVAEKHKNVADVRERAVFMKGESEYQQGNYSDARDSFQDFVKAFPGSHHGSLAMQRLFEIADYWLDDARQDVRLGHPGSFPRRFVNFDRGRKPVFDQDGHAIQALDYIREHDPNGPLADDSLMMEAGYHFTMGDYTKSDQFSDQLIHNYPRSEFQAQAHLLSAESKLQSYKGSSYDGRKLEEARRTLQAALTQFPDKLETKRPRVLRELDEIRQEQAKSQFEVAEWYRHMGDKSSKDARVFYQSARIYYQYVMNNFPGTKWADRAGERVLDLNQKSPSEPTTK